MDRTGPDRLGHLTRWLRPAWRSLFGLALLCFLLPFFSVACATPTGFPYEATVRGYQLVVGVDANALTWTNPRTGEVLRESAYGAPPATSSRGGATATGAGAAGYGGAFGASAVPQRYSGDLTALIAAGLALAGVILGLVRPAVAPLVPAAMATVATLALLLLRGNIERVVEAAGRGPLGGAWYVRADPGYHLALLLFVATAAWCALDWYLARRDIGPLPDLVRARLAAATAAPTAATATPPAPAAPPVTGESSNDGPAARGD